MTDSSHLHRNESSEPANAFRAVPSVDTVVAALTESGIAPEFLRQIVRSELARARTSIQSGELLDRVVILDRCQRAVEELSSTRFDEVINGTGIVLHTNLGRAPVSDATAAAMSRSASSYLSLEIDPVTNRRGGRMNEVTRLMRALTGAEATLVVNNNASAVLLVLAALCEGREVIVSRGEAVEIGGGFRIPEVIAQSGCRLVEVGTTNRTYGSDFHSAAGAATAAILRVHASNFRVEGFTSGVSTAELGVLADELGIPLIEDLGSGALLDTSRFGLRHEPTVEEAIDSGASIVTLSGDKLLGGPQAGIIAGKRELVERIERHPLMRAVRVDKVTLAGVCATLRHYLAGNAVAEIPIWRMIGSSVGDLTDRAKRLSGLPNISIAESVASIGGGSLPGETLPSVALRIPTGVADEVARALRTGQPSVFPIIREASVLIDLRSVQPRQDADLASALRRVLA
jgi:L-seryl-tRNA(Ser) seleniumtransferase